MDKKSKNGKHAKKIASRAVRILGNALNGVSDVINAAADAINPADKPAMRTRIPRVKPKAYDWKTNGEIGDAPSANDPVVHYTPTYRVFVLHNDVTQAVAIVRCVRTKYHVMHEIIRIAAMTTEKTHIIPIEPIGPNGIYSEVSSAIGILNDADGVDQDAATALFVTNVAGIQAKADPKAVMVQWSLDDTPFDFYDPIGASGVDPIDIVNDLYWLAMEGKPSPLLSGGVVVRKDPEAEGDIDWYMPEAFLATFYNMVTGGNTTNEWRGLNSDWHVDVYGQMPIDDVYRTLTRLRDAIEHGARLTAEDLSVILDMYHNKVSPAKPELIPGEIINRYRHLAMAYVEGDEKILWAEALFEARHNATTCHLSEMLHSLTHEESAYLDTDDEDAPPVGRFAEQDTWVNPYDKYIPEKLLSSGKLTPEALYRAVGGDGVYVAAQACKAIVDLAKYGPMAKKD